MDFTLDETQREIAVLTAGVLRGEVHFAVGYTEPGVGVDASAKVFGSEWIQRIVRLMEEAAARQGDLTDPATAELVESLDVLARRNLVLTFGGGVNEIQREPIATAGLGLSRVPR